MRIDLKTEMVPELRSISSHFPRFIGKENDARPGRSGKPCLSCRTLVAGRTVFMLSISRRNLAPFGVRNTRVRPLAKCIKITSGKVAHILEAASESDGCHRKQARQLLQAPDEMTTMPPITLALAPFRRR